MNQSGIYEIVNTVNGRRYIGSAVNFKRRWALHCWGLNRQRHHNQKLQKAWNKYGAEVFTFRILLICAKEHLLMYEQRALDKLRPQYNIAPTAGSLLGHKMSAASRQKIAAAGIGRIVSAETRAKKSAALKGRTLSPEQCAAMSALRLGTTASDETRAKMSAARKGVPWGEKRRAAPVAPVTEATSAKISNALKGRTISGTHRARLSAAKTGKPGTPLSVAHRAKLQAGYAAYRAKLRGEV